MKKIRTSLLLIVSIFLLSSCYKRSGWGLRGKGDVVSEIRHLGSCDKLNVSIDANVEYRQDSAYYLEVIAQPNILAVLETKLKGSELFFEYKRNVWDHKQVRVVVHTPSIRSIRLSGSGNIDAGEIRTQVLDVNISGSGNINMNSLQADALSGNISGSGNLSVSAGNCASQEWTISGSGNVHSDNCQSTVNTSRISGSGNILINVVESLKVSISGSGDVKYRGKPAVTADISGSGKLIQIP